MEMKLRTLLFQLATPAFLTVSAPGMWSHLEGGPRPSGIPDYKIQPFTAERWEASNFASEEEMKWFRDAKYGMFIHFGLSTHNNADLSWGTCRTRKAPDVGQGPVPDEVWTKWPQEFRLEKFDAREWVDLAKRGGFQYMVVIAKHHEGFHLWDTAQSDFKVTNTPFGRDYLREIADACREADMPIGFYYSQRDWYHPDYQPVDPAKVTQKGTSWTLLEGETSPVGERHAKYLEYQIKACEELCTKYGKLDIFWWDASWWGGMFTEEMWDAEGLTRRLRKLQPGMIMNNRCSVPGDFDTPEQLLGNYQDWRPWESCVSLTPTWSYSGKPPKTLAHLIRMIVNNTCCDGNLLLSWGPLWSGEFAANERERLLEVGAWMKKNGRAIYGTRGGPWKFARWGGSVRKGNQVWLHVIRHEGEILRLPAIPGVSVVSARLLDGDGLDFEQDEESLAIKVPVAMQDPVDTIIELTMDRPVDGLPPVFGAEGVGFLNVATHGEVISGEAEVRASSLSPDASRESLQGLLKDPPVEDFAFQTGAEENPWVEIDLKHTAMVTGVRILNRAKAHPERAEGLTLKVSADGKRWHRMWTASEVAPVWEAEVSSYVAGAHVPGRKVRYLRLETVNANPMPLHLRQVQVWGRDEP